MEKIGFGGSCHWCTEAIFQSLKGVSSVEQGWIASTGENNTYSEAVIVHFQSEIIPLEILVTVHLHTHSCTAKHSMRSKYRSAVYAFTTEQSSQVQHVLTVLQQDFDKQLITKVLPFHKFKINQESYLNYYYNNPEKPFCETYISPKLQLIRDRFKAFVDT